VYPRVLSILYVFIIISLAGCSQKSRDSSFDARKIQSVDALCQKFLTSLQKRDYKAALQMSAGDRVLSQPDVQAFSVQDIKTASGVAEQLIGDPRNWSWELGGKDVRKADGAEWVTLVYKIRGNRNSGLFSFQCIDNQGDWEIRYFQFNGSSKG